MRGLAPGSLKAQYGHVRRWIAAGEGGVHATPVVKGDGNPLLALQRVVIGDDYVGPPEDPAGRDAAAGMNRDE